MLFTAGLEKGNRNLGIYELDGDTWKLCLAMRVPNRPKSFATTPGDGLALETCTRASAATESKPAKSASAKENSAQKSAAAGGPATELEGEWQMIPAVI